MKTGSEAKTAAGELTGIIVGEFEKLCAIPHGSGHEKALSDYLKSRLASCSSRIEQDAAGNLLAELPACPSGTQGPVVILQAHMDMVVAVSAPAVGTNPTVLPVLEGSVLHSDGRTSLGADNGIGVAVILALSCRSVFVHGPLRVLFTVSEETGLRGAALLPPRWLAGADFLINTDGFHADTEVIGCKSGCRETFAKELRPEPAPPRSRAFSLSLSGFSGGHSGDDIDKGRCNTVQTLARLLSDAEKELPGLRLAAFSGGIGFNVIPGDSTAAVLVPAEDAQRFPEWIENRGAALLGEFQDRGKLSAAACASPAQCWPRAFQEEVLTFLTELKNGVWERKNGEVSSSCNIGRVVQQGMSLLVQVMLRCDTVGQDQQMMAQHRQAAENGGFTCEISGYHSWHAVPDSLLARTVQCAYEETTGRKMTQKTAKVGLETAFFQQKAPSLQMVCLGAEIRRAHSVGESVDIDSAALLFRVMQKTLTALCAGTGEKERRQPPEPKNAAGA